MLHRRQPACKTARPSVRPPAPASAPVCPRVCLYAVQRWHIPSGLLDIPRCYRIEMGKTTSFKYRIMQKYFLSTL